MSTRVESPPIGGGLVGGRVLIALIFALAIGALAGSLVTSAIFDREAGGTPASVALWDAGKLEAMQGRALAERFRAEPGSVAPWDAGKLEAMQGRALAEQVRHRPLGGPLG